MFQRLTVTPNATRALQNSSVRNITAKGFGFPLSKREYVTRTRISSNYKKTWRICLSTPILWQKEIDLSSPIPFHLENLSLLSGYERAIENCFQNGCHIEG